MIFKTAAPTHHFEKWRRLGEDLVETLLGWISKRLLYVRFCSYLHIFSTGFDSTSLQGPLSSFLGRGNEALTNFWFPCSPWTGSRLLDERSVKRERCEAGACSQASFYDVKGRTVALFLVPRTSDPKYMAAAKRRRRRELKGNPLCVPRSPFPLVRGR